MTDLKGRSNPVRQGCAAEAGFLALGPSLKGEESTPNTHIVLPTRLWGPDLAAVIMGGGLSAQAPDYSIGTSFLGWPVL